MYTPTLMASVADGLALVTSHTAVAAPLELAARAITLSVPRLSVPTREDVIGRPLAAPKFVPSLAVSEPELAPTSTAYGDREVPPGRKLAPRFLVADVVDTYSVRPAGML